MSRPEGRHAARRRTAGAALAAPEPGPAIPRATYRVQLNGGFTFHDATAIVPYLAALGISHVYCSPYFRAHSGSMHGYDVVDHNSFNPEIGGRADFERFVAELRTHGMGHIVDLVPNHVGILGADNVWWMDVLENGEASSYAAFFDIDWSPPNPDRAHKVLVPVLAEPYGTVLERGELELRFEPARGSFALFYHTHRFPLDPRTYPRILDRVPALIANTELENIRRALAALPDRRAVGAEQVAERSRAKELHKQRLAALVADNPAVAAALEAAVRSFTGTAAEPASFDALHELLELQAWHLAYWRVAADDINYRRFFDVNDLAALRVDNASVFDVTHRLALQLIGAGLIDGVRIDHVDGLYDPLGYVCRLQQRVGAVTGRSGTRAPVRGGREDHRLVRAPARGVAGARRDWLPLRQRRQPHAHRLGDPQPHGPRVSHADRRGARMARGGVRLPAAHSAPLARLRAQRRGQPAGAHRPLRPQHARLHLQLAAQRARRGHRLLPGLPHLHRHACCRQ